MMQSVSFEEFYYSWRKHQKGREVKYSLRNSVSVCVCVKTNLQKPCLNRVLNFKFSMPRGFLLASPKKLPGEKLEVLIMTLSSVCSYLPVLEKDSLTHSSHLSTSRCTLHSLPSPDQITSLLHNT